MDCDLLGTKGRILALDYGRSRIGLALSDPSRTIASPAGKIINKGAAKNIEALSRIVNINSVTLIVMGLALHMDGRESEIAHETKQFGTAMHKELGVEVIYYDERFSTKMAEDEIKNKMGYKDPKKIAEIVDTVAACMLLQEYISTQGGRK